MALYDQNTYNGANWYGTAPTTTPTTNVNPGMYSPAPTRMNATPNYNQQMNNGGVSQFVWITNPGVVDMWPVAAGSEMTFIDNEGMMLYVKRVDEYNHPLKTRKFKLTEIMDEGTEPAKASFNMDELKQYIANEIDRGVTNRMNNMFSFNQPVKGDDNV